MYQIPLMDISLSTKYHLNRKVITSHIVAATAPNQFQQIFSKGSHSTNYFALSHYIVHHWQFLAPF